MNAKSIVLVLVALGCGLVAAVGVFQYLDKMPGQSLDNNQVILVATKEIDIREPFTAENVQPLSYPKNRIPLGTLESFDKIDGKFARTRLYPGEPILAAKVMNESDESGSLKVPKGYRVVSVKVDAEASVSSLIQPGDRVDVVAVLKKTSENDHAFAKTILKAVRVFAVDREMTRVEHAGEEAKEARTVSLLVAPDQAEKLAMAGELGRLQLALRGTDDAGLEETPGATVDHILGRSDVADDVNSAGSLILAGRSLPTEITENTAESAQPVWQMTILSPHGAKQFTWTKDNQLPHAGNANGANGSGDTNGTNGGIKADAIKTDDPAVNATSPALAPAIVSTAHASRDD